MRYIYLDSNILVSYFATKDEREQKRKESILNAFQIFASLKNVMLSASIWTITEMVKILINEKGMDRKQVSKIANDFIQDPKLGGSKVYIIEGVHPRKRYDFDDFFHDIREKMIIYSPGWGDAMHVVIMKNNGIKEILTLDGKDDFKIIPGILVIHPKDVKNNEK
ncbi:MAG: type II toxin-antitoxin system VapC family toxin [Candidatus Azambacteria bacterium]|nr:type II toxin-antitoxin system VapC family toxin [Candidatus Azambacteria bacterium]